MSKARKSKEAISEAASNEDSMSEEPKVEELEVQAPKIEEPKIQEPKIQEPRIQVLKRQEIKLQDAKRPTNLRANVMPVDGYVLSVDGKLKKRYESAQEATAAATTLKQSYPVIKVAIYNAAERSYTPVELVEREE